MDILGWADLLQDTVYGDMSQMMVWQVSHASLNMRDEDLAVRKAYGTNDLGLRDIINGIQLYLE